MDEEPDVVEVANATADDDPEVGLRAVASLRLLVESLEQLQVENARSRGWTWERIAGALGVSKQAVHKKHGHGGPGSEAAVKLRRRPPKPWLWRFDPAAGAAVQAAEREARALGHARVGSGHVLVALAGGETGAGAALARLGVDEESVRASLRERVGGPDRPRLDPDALATLGSTSTRCAGGSRRRSARARSSGRPAGRRSASG